MSNRLLRAILALYPRSFRRRYGRELQDLFNDLEAASDHSRLWLVSELLASAVAQRLRAARRDARLTITTLAVVAAVGATMDLHWSDGGQRPPRAIANTDTYVPPTSTRVGSAGPQPVNQSRRPVTLAAVARDLPPPPPPASAPPLG